MAMDGSILDVIVYVCIPGANMYVLKQAQWTKQRRLLDNTQWRKTKTTPVLYYTVNASLHDIVVPGSPPTNARGDASPE